MCWPSGKVWRDFLFITRKIENRVLKAEVDSPWPQHLVRARVEWLVRDKVVRSLLRGMYSGDYDEIEISVPQMNATCVLPVRSP